MYVRPPYCSARVRGAARGHRKKACPRGFQLTSCRAAPPPASAPVSTVQGSRSPPHLLLFTAPPAAEGACCCEQAHPFWCDMDPTFVVEAGKHDPARAPNAPNARNGYASAQPSRRTRPPFLEPAPLPCLRSTVTVEEGSISDEFNGPPVAELPTRALSGVAVFEQVAEALVLRDLDMLDEPEPPTLDVVGRLAKLGEEGEVLQDAEPGGLRAAPNAPLQACTPAATKVPAPAARRADGAPHGRARVVGGV